MENDIEKIATEILNTSRIKPNYTNRDFMNIVIVFQSAMMDKLFALYLKFIVCTRYFFITVTAF